MSLSNAALRHILCQTCVDLGLVTVRDCAYAESLRDIKLQKRSHLDCKVALELLLITNKAAILRCGTFFVRGGHHGA